MKIKLKKIHDPRVYETPVDRIVNLLNLGFSEKEVYKDILEHCSLSLNTEPKKQAIKDQIAQINSMNVFARG